MKNLKINRKRSIGIAILAIAVLMIVFSHGAEACEPDIDITIVEIKDNCNGKITITVKVTNCEKYAVSNVAISLPDGVVPSEPDDGDTYVGVYAKYNVENPTKNPFYCIKFETIGEGPKNCDYDVFTFTISDEDYDKITEIKVQVKAGTKIKTVIFDDVEIDVTEWNNWPMFHHDLEHTGYSTADAPDTNDILWTYDTQSNGVYDYGVYSSPAVVNKILYVGDLGINNGRDGVFYALDANTGEEIWTFETEGKIYSSPAVAENKVYFLCTDGYLYALDKDGNGDGTTDCIWKTWIGINGDKGRWDWSSPAVHDGKVYIASSLQTKDENKNIIGGYVFCINTNNGDIEWYTDIGGQPDSAIAIANGRIYSGTHNFVDDSPTLVSLYEYDDPDNNIKAGDIAWEYSYSDNNPAFGSVNGGGVTVVNGDEDPELEIYFGIISRKYENGDLIKAVGACVAIDEDGNDEWHYNFQEINAGGDKSCGPGWSTSTPAYHNGKIYIGSDDGYMYALFTDVEEGEERKAWAFQTTGAKSGHVFSLHWDYESYLEDDQIVDEHIVTAFKEEGFPIFSDLKTYKISGEDWDWEIRDSVDNILYKIEEVTDVELKIFKIKTDGAIWSSPAVADGKVFFGALDHTMYALDEDNGNLIWSYWTDHSRIRGSPAVACGKVFFGNENGKVYAFGGSGTDPEEGGSSLEAGITWNPCSGEIVVYGISENDDDVDVDEKTIKKKCYWWGVKYIMEYTLTDDDENTLWLRLEIKYYKPTCRGIYHVKAKVLMMEYDNEDTIVFKDPRRCIDNNSYKVTYRKPCMNLVRQNIKTYHDWNVITYYNKRWGKTLIREYSWAKKWKLINKEMFSGLNIVDMVTDQGTLKYQY